MGRKRERRKRKIEKIKFKLTFTKKGEMPSRVVTGFVPPGGWGLVGKMLLVGSVAHRSSRTFP